MLYLLEKYGSAYFLICGETYTIGRKNTDILIEDDASLSRHHATIKIGPSSAVIIDEKSKYKIQKNDKEIPPNTETRIEDGDVIKFGRLKSIYTFKRFTITTTASALDKSQKAALKTIIENLGGHLSQDWTPNCTHLTVNEITLTVKYLHCLLDNKPTVTVSYWESILNSAKNKLPAPNIEDYKPPVTETLIAGQDFNQDLDRTHLFVGKTFVFTNKKRHSQMSDIITKCGGQSMLWNQQWNAKILKKLNSYLFIQCDDNEDVPESLQTIHNELKRLNQRLIPLSEIAFAIFYCSCDKNCNPDLKVVQAVFQTKIEIVEHIPLIDETQTQDVQTETAKDEYIIPPSLDVPFDFPPNNERKRKADEALPSTSRDLDENSNSLMSESKKSRFENPFNSTNNSRVSNNFSNSDTKQLENPFVRMMTNRKRKASDDLNPKSKQPVNPFSKIRNEIVDKVQPIDDNPFINVPVKTEHTVEAVVSNSNYSNSNITETSSVSKEMPSTSECPDGFSTSSWVKVDRSKQSTSTIKIEDADMQKIFERFKNTVITGSMPDLFRKDLDDYTSQTIGSLTNSGVNFKKFKKVAPVQRNGDILNATVNRSMGPIESVAIEQSSDDERADEVEEVVPVRLLPKSKKNISKKFQF